MQDASLLQNDERGISPDWWTQPSVGHSEVERGEVSTGEVVSEIAC